MIEIGKQKHILIKNKHSNVCPEIYGVLLIGLSFSLHALRNRYLCHILQGHDTV